MCDASIARGRAHARVDVGGIVGRLAPVPDLTDAPHDAPRAAAWSARRRKAGTQCFGRLRYNAPCPCPCPCHAVPRHAASVSLHERRGDSRLVFRPHVLRPCSHNDVPRHQHPSDEARDQEKEHSPMCVCVRACACVRVGARVCTRMCLCLCSRAQPCSKWPKTAHPCSDSSSSPSTLARTVGGAR